VLRRSADPRQQVLQTLDRWLGVTGAKTPA